ncbi:MAG: hypothetical protein RQ715_09000 [Methylococcales bacterium]|nr:hypothetical protein [Methylococcales bacterium]
MNDLIQLSFNLGFFTLALIIIGLIKPKLPLFFLEKPTRLGIIMVGMVMLMITITLYGEGTKKLQQEQEEAHRRAERAAQLTAKTRQDPNEIPSAPSKRQTESIDPLQATR